MSETPEDLAPEQALMAGILIARGHDRDEALTIVRADRVTSYLLGAHLAPTLEQLAAMALKVTTLYSEIAPDPSYGFHVAPEGTPSCPECESYTINGCGAKWHDTAPIEVLFGCERHGWDTCGLCNYTTKRLVKDTADA